jgi:hypothetical protein
MRAATCGITILCFNPDQNRAQAVLIRLAAAESRGRRGLPEMFQRPEESKNNSFSKFIE